MKFIRCVLMIIIILLPALSYSDTITLQWDRNTEPDLAGYELLKSRVKSDYSNAEVFNIPLVTNDDGSINHPNSFTLELIETGVYYFTVIAYDNETPSLKSDYSNEVSYEVELTELDSPNGLRRSEG